MSAEIGLIVERHGRSRGGSGADQSSDDLGLDASELAKQRLLAETVGLLLEPLGIDELLGGSELMKVASEIAALQELGIDELAPVTTLLEAVIADVMRDADQVGQILRLDLAARREMKAEDGRPLLRLLRAGASRRHVLAMRRVPLQALATTRAQLAHSVQGLTAAVAAYDSACRASEQDALPSSVTLDLEGEIRHLRAKGSLFGLISTTSDAARDRVGPHLRPHLRDLAAPAMAEVLEKVLTSKRRKEELASVLAKNPEWSCWLVSEDSRRIRSSSVAALEWFLTARDSGQVDPLEAAAMADPVLRRIMATPVAQQLRQPVPEQCAVRQRLTGHAALQRLHQGLTIPDRLPGAALDRWHSEVLASASTLARAVLIMEAGESQQQIQAILQGVRSPFGPADPSRSRVRAIQSGLLHELSPSGGAAADDGVVLDDHPAVAQLSLDTLTLEVQAQTWLSSTGPVRGPLQVALAGRTKGGKTTIRKVLTGDTDAAGIGVGRHRTTRSVTGYEWHGLRFLDTPGVAAYDDDYDAEAASQTCLAADVVVWVFADSLRAEELELLGILMEAGKPLILALNVKSKVDTCERLRLFARRPDLSFDGIDGQLTRVRQLAHEIGSRTPTVLHVQAGAAWQAMRVDDDEALARGAWQASNAESLQSSLHDMLIPRAQTLRAVRLVDSLRVPCGLSHAAIEESLPILESQLDLVDSTCAREKEALKAAITSAESHARRVLRRKIAGLRSESEAFVKSVGNGDPHDAWKRFLGQHDLPAVGEAFEERFRDKWVESGILLDPESRLDEHITEDRLRLRARRPGSTWRFVRAALVGLGKAFTSLFGKKSLVLKGSRGNPWAAAAIVAATVIAAVGKEISSEIGASDIEDQAWRQDSSQAVRAAIDTLEHGMHDALSSTAAKTRTRVTSHYERTASTVSNLHARSARLRSFQGHLDRAVGELDLVLVRRLLELNGEDPTIAVRARRAPDRFHVWVEGPSARKRVRTTLAAAMVGAFEVQLTVHTAGVTQATTHGSRRSPA